MRHYNDLLVLRGYAILLVFAVIWFILKVIARYKYFTKAKQKGWKAFIPIYNTYVEYTMVFSAKAYIVYFLTLVVCFVSGLYSYVQNNNFLVSISFVANLINAILMIAKEYYLAKSFGYGVGFTLGLLFLNPIFMLIIAFGSSQYVGPMGQAIQEDPYVDHDWNDLK